MVFISSHCFADDQFNIDHFNPAIGNEVFRQLRTSSPIDFHGWQFGSLVNFSNQLLQSNLGSLNVVDELVTEHFLGRVSLLKGLDIGFDMPLVYLTSFQDPNTTPLDGTQGNFQLNDLRFEMKVRIVDKVKHDFGISLEPYFTVPTGNENKFLGASSVTGGALLTVDIPLGEHWLVATNMGIDIHPESNFGNLRPGNTSFLYGAGLAFSPTERLTTSLELFGQTPGLAAFEDKAHTPTEVLLNAAYDFGESGFSIYGGAGTGIVNAAGSPRIRGYLGLNFSSSFLRHKDS